MSPPRRNLLKQFLPLVAILAAVAAGVWYFRDGTPARLEELRESARSILAAENLSTRQSIAANAYESALPHVGAESPWGITASLYALGFASIAQTETDVEVPRIESVDQVATDDLLLMCRMLTQSELYGQASQLIALALDRDDQRAEILKQAIALHYEIGREDDVLQHCEELSKLEPDSSHPYRTMMQVYRNQGRWDNFVPAAEAAVDRTNGDDWVLLIELIDGYTHLGQTAPARRLLDKVIEHRPDLVERAPAMHARLLLQEGRTDRVTEIVDRLLDADPQDMEALLIKGKLKVAQGEFEDAIDLLERVLALSPAEEQAFYQLGQAHARLGHRQQAREYLSQHRQLLDAKVELYQLEQLAAQQPDNGMVRVQLAEMYRNIGLQELADFWLQSAMASGYSDSELQAVVKDLQIALAEIDPDRVESTIRELRSSSRPTLLVPAPLMFRSGQELKKRGRLSSAEWCFEKAVQLAPGESGYRLELLTLKYITGRYDQAERHLTELLKRGGLDLIRFPLLGNRTIRWVYEDRTLEAGLELTEEEPLARLGLAQKALKDFEFERAETLLKPVLGHNELSPYAGLLWCRLLHEAGRVPELEIALPALTSEARSQADFWVLIGLIERDAGRIEPAVRCFCEALRRDPNRYQTNDQLGRLLQRIGRSDQARLFIERARSLRDYAELCRIIHNDESVGDPSYYREAVRLSEAIGGLKEARAWCMVAGQIAPEAEWPRQEFNRLSRRIDPLAGRLNPELDIRRRFDLDEFPLPEIAPPADPSPRLEEPLPPLVQFSDWTDRAGIDFTFEDGKDLSTKETLLFEFTGGGVAVLDYDRDGDPDLFFTQGGPPPRWGNPQPDDSADRPTDRFYRNQGTGRFAEMTGLLGVTDDVYGQGVAVGDFDADGFPDLYVVNVGENVLFRNNGDGTMSRVPVPAFGENITWTTSALMADLNGDALPDLYDVTYVTETGIHAEMCKSGEATVPCFKQQKLVEEQDRFFLNLGNGQFRHATEDFGFQAENGLGLGAVAADFDGQGQLELFVANDARPNFLFLKQEAATETSRFADEALLRGVAYNGDGRSQACMGVAADDANGDGLLDLFVTNFYADYNTVYQQAPGLIFEDRTASAGLSTVSYQQLGFGTQFLDIDLDGDPDLVLTNGDVDDFSRIEPDRKYRQRPQVLLNTGEGRFEELTNIGEFFEGEYLGRGLARLDWNGDGREEFAVSHIDDRAALLKNETQTSHHYLAVRLAGTRSCRDAVGAIVTVESGDSSQTRQLTAGDGYLASNEQQLIFGLGNSESIERITVRWPSGEEEIFFSPEIDRSIILVEGTGRVFDLPEEAPTPDN